MAVEVIDSDEGQDPFARQQAKRARIATRVRVGKFCVDPIGLGTMPLGIEYPDPGKRPSRIAALQLLHTAFRSGVEFLDTADSYYAGPGGGAEAASPHYVERLIAEAILTYDGDTSNIRVCTKGGMKRIDSTSRGWRPRVCSGALVRQMIMESFDALGGKRAIDMFMLHHTDTLNNEQLVEALKAMHEAVMDGKVLCLGLANATVDNLELAERCKVTISAVQNQYSLWWREAEEPRPPGWGDKSRKGILDWCATHGLAFMPYGVFGGVQSRDGRRSLQHSFPRLVEIAAKRQTSPAALVLAWMRLCFPCTVHIVGARSRQHVLDCARARQLFLTLREIDEIAAMTPNRASVRRPLPVGDAEDIHLEIGTLSAAPSGTTHDFQNDMGCLGVDKGIAIFVEIPNDCLRIRGDAAKRASALAALEEIIKFYFGQGIPW